MLSIFIGLIAILYVSTFSSFLIGWRRTAHFKARTTDDALPKISVVVACKNEVKNLPNLLQSLSNQSTRNFQLVMINDHSSDGTLDLLNQAKLQFDNLLVIDASGQGKKQALKEGIMLAEGELILTTDADCIPHQKWVETFQEFYQTNPSDLIIGAVTMSADSTIFSQLQTLEFVAMVASGAGAAGIGTPILCNGANLGFRKSTWINCQSELRTDLNSGDDMFLLQSIKRIGGTIRFLKSTESIAETAPAGSLSEFITQRRRWASKSTAYTDFQIIFVSCLVMSICLVLIGVGISAMIFHGLAIYLFALFLVKLLTDYLFTSQFKQFFQLKNLFLYSLVLSLIYPFYVVIIGVSSLAFRQLEWK
jgi:poly-beta-1,6-N-acetyl-D-glucosamine synthase